MNNALEDIGVTVGDNNMANKMMEITCPECGGDGTVWFLDWLYYDGGHDEHEEYCDMCNGEGTVIVDAEDYYANHIDETPEGFWEEEEE